ncbi:Rpn14p Ecym_6167 [Eremothecium cymbalariae DBVPG|uniref:Uncharacterized protein n=1 Tax=Eremothecium cymbalariae (strain CBS 270.75 / DBVPG 7215 / KCTC 17166 / NRRL Y-17582) TaxID=931890 RepID=G8JV73_ERECY|nr:hypothetical protein Ecym_6167 [Eremothecium cymbalariae DBVPG\
MGELPSFHIQADVVECIKDVEQGKVEMEQFYINVEPDIHTVKDYTVKVSKVEDEIVFDAGEGNVFKKVSPQIYEASFEGGKHKCYFKLPSIVYTKDIISGRESESSSARHFTAFDLVHTPEESWCAFGDSNGKISVYKHFSLDKELDGHADYVTSLKFFPSGEVLLSTSMDMQVKIWSAVDGSNPRTFTGHKAAVTESAIIGRGRNILSCSKDGTIKLWECGSGTMLRNFRRDDNAFDGINTMQLLDLEGRRAATVNENHLEYSTENKTVIAGHFSGVLTYHDIYSKQQIAEFPSQFSSPCTTLSCNNTALGDSLSHYIYAGYENGCIAQWDTRYTNKAVNHLFFNKGASADRLFYFQDSLYVSSNVDSSCQISLDSRGNFKDQTFLVADDHKIAQYVADPNDKSIWAVGDWSFCAKY